MTEELKKFPIGIIECEDGTYEIYDFCREDLDTLHDLLSTVYEPVSDRLRSLRDKLFDVLYDEE